MSNKSCPPPCEKKDGGQDHRCNKDKDRTPAQKDGDAKRKKQIVLPLIALSYEKDNSKT